jgi:hypothetical protein
MAFLDNSGDIILDAVLTETGRKRMADGNFSISKFALGDDEINYSQFNRSHPSGSAYYDLEILQTPVLEAVTAQNSAINYGLLSMTNNNLLYMPSIKVNQNFERSAQISGTIFYVATNSETHDKLRTAGLLGAESKKVILANAMTDTQLLYWESGIDDSTLTADSTNRSNYIVANDMLDTSFTVQVDNRLFSGLKQLDGSTSFSAAASSTTITVPSALSEAGSGTTATSLSNYTNYSIRGVSNLLYTPTVSTRSEKSVIAGPRGTAAAIVFNTTHVGASGTSTPSVFTQYGKTAQNLFSSGDTFDYIDTTVYITGVSSTRMAQVPVRLIRLNTAA